MSETLTPEKATPLRKRGSPMVTLGAYLYLDQAEALARLAERSDISRSTLIRHAVQRFLADHPESGLEG
jgi:hypothetical protein